MLHIYRISSILYIKDQIASENILPLKCNAISAWLSLLIFACLVVFAQTSDECSVDDGYTLYPNGKCYKAFTKDTNCAARVTCNKEKARLAMLKNKEDVLLHNNTLTGFAFFPILTQKLQNMQS